MKMLTLVNKNKRVAQSLAELHESRFFEAQREVSGASGEDDSMKISEQMDDDDNCIRSTSSSREDVSADVEEEDAESPDDDGVLESGEERLQVLQEDAFFGTSTSGKMNSSVEQRLPFEPPSLHEQLLELRRRTATENNMLKAISPPAQTMLKTSIISTTTSSIKPIVPGFHPPSGLQAQAAGSRSGSDARSETSSQNNSKSGTPTSQSGGENSARTAHKEYRVRQLRLGSQGETRLTEGSGAQVLSSPAESKGLSTPQLVDIFPPQMDAKNFPGHSSANDHKPRKLSLEETKEVYARLWRTAVRDTEKKQQLELQRREREMKGGTSVGSSSSVQGVVPGASASTSPEHARARTGGIGQGQRATDRLYRDASNRRRRSVSTEKEESRQRLMVSRLVSDHPSAERKANKEQAPGSSLQPPRVQVRKRSRSAQRSPSVKRGDHQQQTVAERLYQESFKVQQRRQSLQDEDARRYKDLSRGRGRGGSSAVNASSISSGGKMNAIGVKDGPRTASRSASLSGKRNRQEEGNRLRVAAKRDIVDQAFATAMAHEEVRKRANSLETMSSPVDLGGSQPSHGSGCGEDTSKSPPADEALPSRPRAVTIKEAAPVVAQQQTKAPLSQPLLFMEDHVSKNFASPHRSILKKSMVRPRLEIPPAKMKILPNEKLLSTQQLPGGGAIFVRDPSRNRQSNKDVVAPSGVVDYLSASTASIGNHNNSFSSSSHVQAGTSGSATNTITLPTGSPSVLRNSHNGPLSILSPGMVKIRSIRPPATHSTQSVRSTSAAAPLGPGDHAVAGNTSNVGGGGSGITMSSRGPPGLPLGSTAEAAKTSYRNSGSSTSTGAVSVPTTSTLETVSTHRIRHGTRPSPQKSTTRVGPGHSSSPYLSQKSSNYFMQRVLKQNY
eukprot:CAMPEP_0178996376 /NCGR_PEP_ID=MMETSP0795-20121207/8336_1 /TAXON_ID=88552 /ORGANISM="Amoebophrya sp., Strain Ameob2" /LENGTH=897 /DNA_ID=CAMNT_0020688763 /DNA_START=94 /DNA_END=2787 /DNA_ORIENTATION=-